MIVLQIILRVLLIIIAALLIIVGILLVLPVTFYFSYEKDKTEYRLKILGIPIKLKPKKKNKKSGQTKTEDTNKKILSDLSDLKEMLPSVFKYAKNAFVIKNLCLEIRVSTDDPYDTTMVYGAINAAVSAVLSIVRNNVTVKNTDIRINADYTQEQTRMKTQILFHSRVFKILYALIMLMYNKII